jgi:hypothetical protein
LLGKIRVPVHQANPQAGCDIGEEDTLSFTHSNLHRAVFLLAEIVLDGKGIFFPVFLRLDLVPE